jgi:hypothetical protein
MEWLNSLSAETLRSINTSAQILGLLCTAGLLVSGYFVWASSDRLSELAAEGEKALHDKVARAEESIRRTEHERRPRTLDTQGRQALATALAQLPRRKIDVESIVGDLEGDAYGNKCGAKYHIASMGERARNDRSSAEDSFLKKFCGEIRNDVH